MFKCVSSFGNVHACSAHKGQKRALDLLELELQAIDCLGAGTKPRSSARAVHTPNRC